MDGLLSPRDQLMQDINHFHHMQRIKKAKPVVDMRPPVHVSIKTQKKQVLQQEQKRNIEQQNFKIAHRIFDIFNKTARIQTEVQTGEYLEHHPGTLNYNNRLSEAKRINKHNNQMAKRLESIKSYYNKKDFIPPPRKLRRPRVLVNKGNHAFMSNYGNDAAMAVLSNPKDANILLFEYSKIQNDRVIDVAVTKDAIDSDEYTIYGVDVDSGQKYELHLSAGLLEENILITAVNDPNVWMALLNRRELVPVDSFHSPAKHQKLTPRAPEFARPSGVRPIRGSVVKEAEKAISRTEARISKSANQDELERLEEAAKILQDNMKVAIAKKRAIKETSQKLREDKAAMIISQIIRKVNQKKKSDQGCGSREDPPRSACPVV